MARAGRPPVFAPPSLDRAFMIGNELIAASEKIVDPPAWRAFVAQTGLSTRSARRYIVFAHWANEHTEELVALLHMKRQPSFLIAPRVAALLFRSRLKTQELADRSEARKDCQ